MVTIETDPIAKAIEQLGKPHRTVGALCESSEGTVNKLLKGEPNLALSAIARIADYFGFDVIVTFRERKAATT